MRKFAFILSLFFTVCFCCGKTAEPVGVIRCQNPTIFLKKFSTFLGKINPQAANRKTESLSSFMYMHKLSALNFQKPLTAYLFYIEQGIQTVFFGELQKGKLPEPFYIFPGQTLTPTVQKGIVKYVDAKFKQNVEALTPETVKLPQKLLAGRYFFRDQTKSKMEPVDPSSDLAAFLTAEFKSISFSLDFPKEDLLVFEMDLEAANKSNLTEFSNRHHPRFSEKPAVLPNPEFYIYTELPASQTADYGVISFFSLIVPDFANDEHIYGAFMHSIADNNHPTALMLSKNQDYYLFSGILPSAEQKTLFEKFLKDHGNTYSGKSYMFHCENGTNVYAAISGNTANLLIKRKNHTTQGIPQTFSSLKKLRPALAEREFLIGKTRIHDGSYQNMLSGTMSNGKFRLKADLNPYTVAVTLPRLLLGEELFLE